MNRMKGKKILAALGFFSIAGAAGGCSQPAPNIRYQIETDQQSIEIRKDITNGWVLLV